MPVFFREFPGAIRPTLKRYADAAMAALEWDETLTATLGVPDGENSSAAAGAIDGRIWVNPSWARDKSNDDAIRAFVMFEEVGHLFLGSLGVPHVGPFAVATQEAYATWFTVELARESGLFDPDRFVAQAVPSSADSDIPLLYYFVGRLLGAAMAGSEPHRKHLDDWLATRGDAPAPQHQPLVALCRSLLSADLTDAGYRETGEAVASLWANARQKFVLVEADEVR